MLVFFILSSALLYFSVKLVWWYFTESNNGYWKKQGVPTALPQDYAPYLDIFLGKTKSEGLDLYYYNKHKDEPFVGTMEFRRPVLIIRDLELQKRIYVKDFDHFVNRRSFNVDSELNSKFLFIMKDQEWKDLRSTMSPTFTSGKMKRMFDYFTSSGKDLKKYVEDHQRKTGSDSVELRNLYGRYIMDLLASTAFGIDGKCLTEENSEFMRNGRAMLQYGAGRTAKTFFSIMFPKLAQAFGVEFFDKQASSFFKSVMSRVLKDRRSNPGNHKDFIQLMMDAQANNKAALQVGSDELDTFEKEAQLKASETSHYQVTDDNILANGLIFINAGFEGTETTLTLATYFCALYPEMQTRLREEIETVLEEFNGEMCYEAVAKMNYLDMFISEVTRLYPPFTRTERIVTKEYKIPDTNVVLPEGLVISMPILGVHRDEKYFPDPEKFDPERFTAENKQNRHPYAYQTFGHGPRNCIGMRYALIEVKAGLVQIVKNFDISPSADTLIPLQFEQVPSTIKPSRSLGVSLKPRV